MSTPNFHALRLLARTCLSGGRARRSCRADPWRYGGHIVIVSPAASGCIPIVVGTICIRATEHVHALRVGRAGSTTALDAKAITLPVVLTPMAVKWPAGPDRVAGSSVAEAVAALAVARALRATVTAIMAAATRALLVFIAFYLQRLLGPDPFGAIIDDRPFTWGEVEAILLLEDLGR